MRLWPSFRQPGRIATLCKSRPCADWRAPRIWQAHLACGAAQACPKEKPRPQMRAANQITPRGNPHTRTGRPERRQAALLRNVRRAQACQVHEGR